MANKVSIPTKVITGVNTRWSYANVWDPKSINGGAPKFSVSLIIPKSDTATIAKIKAAIEAASPFPHSPPSRHLSATAIWKDRMMRLTRTPTSSTPTARRLPESLMPTGTLSLNAPKSIPAYMAELPSTSTLSTATAIRASPAV